MVASGYARLEHLKPQTMTLSQVGGELLGKDGLNTKKAEGGRTTGWERTATGWKTSRTLSSGTTSWTVAAKKTPST